MFMAGQKAAGQTVGESKETICAGHDWAGWLNPHKGLRLKLWTGGSELHIAVQGRVEADMVLEDLHQVLAEPHNQTRLHLDLSAVLGLDPIGVSALIVLMRHRGPAFERISLTGLPPQAAWRLRNKGAHDLLGPDWDGCFDNDQARYTRH